MGAVALAVSVSMVPTVAVASGPSAMSGLRTTPTGTGVAAATPVAWTQALLWAKKKKKKKKGGLTPEAAQSKRQAIVDAVAGDVESENWEAAADETENNASLLGDPVSYQQAAEYRLRQAEADRDIDAANAAIETATVALDIFHFYDAVDSGDATSQWLVIAPSDASSGISAAEDIISRAESLIEEIEAEQEDDGLGVGGSTDDGKKKKKKRGKAKPGTILIGVGAGVAALGLGGLGVGIAGIVISGQRQDEVDELMLPEDQARVDELDEEGARANTMGLVGMITGGVLLLGGVTLVAVGAVRRKKAGGGGGETARLRFAPALSRGFGGMTVQGRF